MAYFANIFPVKEALSGFQHIFFNLNFDSKHILVFIPTNHNGFMLKMLLI